MEAYGVLEWDLKICYTTIGLKRKIVSFPRLHSLKWFCSILFLHIIPSRVRGFLAKFLSFMKSTKIYLFIRNSPLSNLCTHAEKCSFIVKYKLCFMRCTHEPNCPLSNSWHSFHRGGKIVIITEIAPPLNELPHSRFCFVLNRLNILY